MSFILIQGKVLFLHQVEVTSNKVTFIKGKVNFLFCSDSETDLSVNNILYFNPFSAVKGGLKVPAVGREQLREVEVLVSMLEKTEECDLNSNKDNIRVVSKPGSRRTMHLSTECFLY